MTQPFNADDFRRLATEAFPELCDEFEEDPDLLHVQVSALARLAQRAKGAADWSTYRRCMELAGRFWRSPDAELSNALNVSFLEEIDFAGTNGATAWTYLSPELQRGWTSMQRYLEELGESARKQQHKHP